MKKLGIGILGLVLAGNVFGANWVLASENNDTKAYVDVDSIIIKPTSSQHLVGAWQKIELKKPSVMPAFGTEPLKQIVSFKWNDCKNNSRSDDVQSSSYDVNGKVTYSDSAGYDSTKFKMPIPGTTGEALEDIACIAALSKETKNFTNIEDKGNIAKTYYPKQYDYIINRLNRSKQK